MNEELKAILEEVYQYASEAQREDMIEAEVCLNKGEMERYFDLNIYLQLADCCWALEKWDEAKHWYRHNARLFRERREWYNNKRKIDSADVLLDWEAVTSIRAGELDSGKILLVKAIDFYKVTHGNELILSTLGMHAVQVGMDAGSPYVQSAITARKQLQSENNPNILANIESLHYEPAMAMILSGKWNEFLDHVEKLKETRKFISKNPKLFFPPDLQNALVYASEGLLTIATIYQNEKEDEFSHNGVKAFEKAMLSFYRFSSQIDSDIYFMRLASRFIRELKETGQIKANPFASS